ncbi:Alpha/Beta hydrolase protein [Nemania abortiva]|nr:Alpha/Beta hydrolase protein [Nemania abortiva]
MTSLPSKETMSKEIDIDSTTETDLDLSSRASSELKNAEYIEERNKNRVEQENSFADGFKKLEKRLAFPGSTSTMMSVAGTGQSISSPFQSTLSSQNSGAMSAAATEAMYHLNRVLQYNSRAEERGFLKYIEKVNMIPIHRLAAEELTSCQLDGQDWALIKHAADMSKKVYDDNIEDAPDVVVHKVFTAGVNMKPAIVSTHNHGNKKVLIVTVRGTVTTDDWMLNVNGDPETSQAFEENTQWHRGFLAMALKMQKEIAKVVEKVASQNNRPEQILFTGHSAGGAIAQILYALSMRTDSAMAKAIQGFPTVHCVTFAAPPVSRPPIVPDPARNPQHAQGKFFAVINEGDPVPLAQREYIYALLDVYGKSIKKLEEEGLDKFKVPVPMMQLSGQCLLLRDEGPSRFLEFNIGAYSVEVDVLQSKLFGNPLEHFMIEYQSRIYRVLDLGKPIDKDMDIDI